MSAVAATRSANQISPADERVYRQSNLLGDWKGTWSKNHQTIGFKVVSIKGNAAQVEYTHNGHTERGIGVVNGGTITYGSIMVGTRDGQVAGIEFTFGNAKMSGVLAKSTAPVEQDKLVGAWIGTSPDTGQTTSVQILAIKGRDAQVRYTVNGYTQQGIGTVYKNTVMIGKVQVTSDDGVNGTVIFPVGRQTLSVDVEKFTPPSSSSSVNKLA
jgi:hypothetical protein